MYKGSKLISTLENECSENGNRDMYRCMDSDVHENKPIDLPYVLKYYNEQYKYTSVNEDLHYAKDISHMKS